ncbi:hypothetical protein BKA61DRAFT_594674 [Leptodontidium sp. MPI-SDFR-AT-0119]|nr:hypothetical protein BKA61DRAFT_594674 [Leptodontidium sp. MPI-SDFR-AT-0119]
MNRCTISYGSSTAKWLATATRSHSTRTSSYIELQTRWMPSRVWQSRGISSTNQHSFQAEPLSVGDDLPAESATGLAKTGGDTASVGNGAVGKEESTVSGSQPSSTTKTESSSVSNVSTADSSSNALHDGPKPFKRRPLPLSPLMDPAFLEARQRHKTPKPPPTKTPTSFQQQLAKNPFALALATPVRRCVISGTKLPSFFLQGFRVMSDPKTGDPWYVPTRLANKHLPAMEKEHLDKVKELEEVEELKGVEALEGSEDSENATAVVVEKPTPSKIGYQVYTLNRKDLLQSITNSESKRTSRGKTRSIHSRFLPAKWHGIKSVMKAYNDSAWRPDMGDFVRILMGRRISEALVHLCKLKRGYLVGCSDWEDALKKPQAAAFLWTGNRGDEEIEGPPEFATLDIGSQDFDAVGPQLGRKKRKVPVYNLLTLLGKEKMDELRQLVPKSVFEKEIVVLKHKNVTVELQSLLWKIQGYLAEYQDRQVARLESNKENTQTDQVIESSEAFEPKQ